MPTTAEDAYLNFDKLNKLESVHLEHFEKANKVNEKIIEQWQEFFNLRDEINGLLENAIKDGLIKRTNEAKLTLKVKNDFIKSLDLKQLLMVGMIEFGSENKVEVFNSVKCLRCWNHFIPSQIKDDICPLCHKVVYHE